MKKNLVLLFFLFLYQLSLAQVDSSEFWDHRLYVYKSEDDFFLKKKIYRGQYIPSEDKKTIKYKGADSKKRILNLEDSCHHYFGYQIGDETWIRPDKDPRNFSYYVFGGGTSTIYCVVYGHLPNYDRKGYLLGLTSPAGMIHQYFVDHSTGRNMIQLTELLEPKPRLLELYKAEKGRTPKEDWERNKLAIGIKYLKLYIAENK